LSLGHEGRPTLLSASDKSELIAVQVKAIEHTQITLPRYSKRMGDALSQKAFNKQMASNFFSHGCIVPKPLPHLCHHRTDRGSSSSDPLGAGTQACY
jgi:hypothetical protein